MITFEGKTYYAYMLLTEVIPIFGLDERPHAEIQKEWLDKSRIAAERQAQVIRGATRAGIHNETLLHKKVEGPGTDPVLTPEGVGEAIDLAEVAAPPVESRVPDEVLTLRGLPEGSMLPGYGSVSVLADEVLGVARAWGDDAEDICSGLEPRRIRPAPKQRTKAKKGRKR